MGVDKDVNDDLSRPAFFEINSNVPLVRRNEGVVGIRGGICPYYFSDSCNHCSLPSYSTGKPDKDFIVPQVDYALDRLSADSVAKDLRVISVYNGGSAFDPKEISREALYDFFSKVAGRKRDGVFSKLEKVSVESRDVFVDYDVLYNSLAYLDGLDLEVCLGFESLDERVRNGDVDNSMGRIGLNKRVSLGSFERAVDLIGDVGASAKFYVMMGAVPWLAGDDVVRDVVQSVDYLHGVSLENGFSTAIHLNPMYPAKGSVLYDVWKEKGFESLPDGFDVVRALEEIDFDVARIGSGDIYVYLGLDSEGLGELNIDGEFCEAFVDFNKTQDLEKLVSFRDGLR